MRCIQICDKVQNLQVWDVQNTGSRTTVNVSLNRSIEEAECSLCGQCITHCPVNALHVREDSERAFAAFNDPDKITIVQIAPAVRAAWGESLGLRREEATIEKLGDAFRRMGADYVFDTDFAADLTIMEEASEFLERLHHNKEQEMPMLPPAVRLGTFSKSQYADMISHLPHQNHRIRCLVLLRKHGLRKSLVLIHRAFTIFLSCHVSQRSMKLIFRS